MMSRGADFDAHPSITFKIQEVICYELTVA